MLVIAAAVGCQNATPSEADETAVTNAVEEAPKLYEPSELAQLMRKMYEDNQDLKSMVERGEVPQSFPEDFYTIHSAVATNPNDINDTYKALAQTYIESMERIVNSDPGSVKENFNNMVTTCISCHQIFCQGPIPKIKKLTIAE